MKKSHKRHKRHKRYKSKNNLTECVLVHKTLNNKYKIIITITITMVIKNRILHFHLFQE